MQFTTEQNKQLVIRFNKEYVEKGDRKSFEELVAEDVVNHAAPPGTSQGPDGMIHFLQNILRTGFPDLSVEILDQLRRRPRYTRKAIHATHSGDFMGIPPTGKKGNHQRH
jgi:predicted ester cyclase